MYELNGGILGAISKNFKGTEMDEPMRIYSLN